MWALADRCATSGASDPAQVIKVAAEGAYVVGGMMGVIRGDQVVVILSRDLRLCLCL